MGWIAELIVDGGPGTQEHRLCARGTLSDVGTCYCCFKTGQSRSTFWFSVGSRACGAAAIKDPRTNIVSWCYRSLVSGDDVLSDSSGRWSPGGISVTFACLAVDCSWALPNGYRLRRRIMRDRGAASPVEGIRCGGLRRVRIQHRYVAAGVCFVLMNRCSRCWSSWGVFRAGLTFIVNVYGVFHLLVRFQLLPVLRVINFGLKIGSSTTVRAYKLGIRWR